MAKITPYTLTLNISLEAEDDLDIVAMTTALGHVVNESMYTNHPSFFSQMFDHALTAQLKQAFRNMVETACQRIFQYKMVPTPGGRGEMAKWLIEADNRLEKLLCPGISTGRTRVTITKGRPQ